jgi:hypothetical protein
LESLFWWAFRLIQDLDLRLRVSIGFSPISPTGAVALVLALDHTNSNGLTEAPKPLFFGVLGLKKMCKEM